MGKKKAFTIQQEVTKQKKSTRKITKSRPRALIGQECYAF